MLEQAETIELARTDSNADEAAVEVLVRAQSRLVFQICYSVLRNYHDAEDAVQETFLRVMRHRRELSDVQNVRSWLARIAWRVALDGRRKNPVADDAMAETALAELQDQGAGAEQVAMDAQRLAVIERLIAKLPDDLREALTLSTVEEMTSVEIAAVLGIPEASVRTRVHRARRLLKEKLVALLEARSL